MVASRLGEPLPVGQLDVDHYRAIHRHLFQDVYTWAGRDRQVRTHKGDTTFCYPENIRPEMRRLFDGLARDRHLRGLDPPSFARAAAKFIGDLNAIHPFREGNGRVQQTFLVLVADQAGHTIDLSRVRRESYLRAMISAYAEDEVLLAAEIESWMVA